MGCGTLIFSEREYFIEEDEVAQRGSIADFVMFVLDTLADDTKGKQAIADEYADRFNLSPASRRDFMGLLREFGVDVNAPDIIAKPVKVEPHDTVPSEKAPSEKQTEAEAERAAAVRAEGGIPPVSE